MDISGSITLIIGLSYVSLTMYLANQEQITGERGGLRRWLLYGVVGVMFLYGLFILQLPFIPPQPDLPLPHVDAGVAALIFVAAAVLSVFSARIVASAELRGRIRRVLPSVATFNPESPVHTTACVLLLAFVVITIGNFVAGGGIEGMAQSLESTGLSFDDFLFENVLWIVAATLGVGLFLRRAPAQTLNRLGLRLPTSQDITWGIGVGVLLFGVLIAVGMVWTQFVTPEQFAQQTAASEQFASLINTLPLSFAISVVVAIGEETFFRGALQPVFGIWATSILFAIIHTQYTLTPATLLIFITALAFGWLRQRHSTTSAIFAHFVYNFIQLALAVLLGSAL